MQNNNLDNIRMPRTKESTIFEMVLGVIIIINCVFLYIKSGGDSGTMTIAAIIDEKRLIVFIKSPLCFVFKF